MKHCVHVQKWRTNVSFGVPEAMSRSPLPRPRLFPSYAWRLRAKAWPAAAMPVRWRRWGISGEQSMSRPQPFGILQRPRACSLAQALFAVQGTQLSGRESTYYACFCWTIVRIGIFEGYFSKIRDRHAIAFYLFLQLEASQRPWEKFFSHFFDSSCSKFACFLLPALLRPRPDKPAFKATQR